MDTIKVLLQGDSWMAYHTGPFAAEIVDLFGTPILPTAFMVAMPKQEVIAALVKLNPGVHVA